MLVALLRADLDEDGRAAPVLGHELVLGERLLDALGVSAPLSHLVDRRR